MKRRKTISKYHVDEVGRIKNDKPHISQNTKDMLAFMSMMDAISGYTSRTELPTLEGEVVGEMSDDVESIVCVDEDGTVEEVVQVDE